MINPRDRKIPLAKLGLEIVGSCDRLLDQVICAELRARDAAQAWRANSGTTSLPRRYGYAWSTASTTHALVVAIKELLRDLQHALADLDAPSP